MEVFGVFFGLAWFGAFAAVLGAIAGRSHERKLWQKRFERKGIDRDEPKRLTETDAPLSRATQPESAQLANAIDAIAVEVERIGESQRFLTRLLAERDQRFSAPKSPSPVPGSVRSPLPPTA